MVTVLFLPSIDPYAKDWIFLMSFRSPVFFETQHKTVYQNFFWPFSNVVDLWQMKENWVALTKQCLQYKQNSFEWPDVWISIIYKLLWWSKKNCAFFCKQLEPVSRSRNVKAKLSYSKEIILFASMKAP